MRFFPVPAPNIKEPSHSGGDGAEASGGFLPPHHCSHFPPWGHAVGLPSTLPHFPISLPRGLDAWQTLCLICTSQCCTLPCLYFRRVPPLVRLDTRTLGDAGRIAASDGLAPRGRGRRDHDRNLSGKWGAAGGGRRRGRGGGRGGGGTRGGGRGGSPKGSCRKLQVQSIVGKLLCTFLNRRPVCFRDPVLAAQGAFLRGESHPLAQAAALQGQVGQPSQGPA